MPYRPPRTVCRQCPGYRDTSSFTPVAAASRALSDALDNTASACIYLCSLVACRSIHRTVFYLQASCCCFDHVTCCVLTSLITVLGRDAKTMPVAPPFSRKADQIHILCSCCLQPIPDRRRMTAPVLGAWRAATTAAAGVAATAFRYTGMTGAFGTIRYLHGSTNKHLEYCYLS